jgi:hypothetical protein
MKPSPLNAEQDKWKRTDYRSDSNRSGTFRSTAQAREATRPEGTDQQVRDPSLESQRSTINDRDRSPRREPSPRRNRSPRRYRSPRRDPSPRLEPPTYRPQATRTTNVSSSRTTTGQYEAATLQPSWQFGTLVSGVQRDDTDQPADKDAGAHAPQATALQDTTNGALG